MRALVTGAGGFLGRYIAEMLVARGDFVRTFSRGSYPQLKQPGMNCLQGDLQDASAVAKACEGIDVVFHTAARPGVWGSWKDYYRPNVVGTRNVLGGCQQAKVPKLVYSSSPSVTFSGKDQCNIDESAPYAENWLCNYPKSKAMAEQEVLAASGKEGVATCALRPHLIWGPRDNHLIPRLLDRARRGRLRKVGSGENLIDIIYVENAAAAHLQAADALSLESPLAGRAYFLSHGEPVNCWDWINEVLALADLPPVKKSISFKAAWRIGATLEKLYGLLHLKNEPPMTRFLAAQLATSHYFDITRAREDFGYNPKISTAEGMRRMAASWRA